MKKLYRVQSKFFCAGFVVNELNRCIECAPILRVNCIGKHIDEILDKYKNIGCDIDLIGEYPEQYDLETLDLFFKKK